VNSTLKRLLYDVPHGSVLGPLWFVLYSADVVQIADSHSVCIRVYADSLQTYASCAAIDQQTAECRLLSCIADIHTWMSSNRLKLNADKTEFIRLLGTRQQLLKVVATPLQVKDQLLQPTDTVRDLGVLIDSQMTMEAHVRNVIHS